MAGQEQQVRVSIPVSALKRAGIDRDDQLQLKVRNDALVLEKIKPRQPQWQQYLIIWPRLVAILSGLAR